MRRGAALAAAVVVLLVLAGAGRTDAHPLDPALLDVRETAPAALEVSWRVPRAAGDALVPALPERCRDTSARLPTAGLRSVVWRWSAACDGSLVGGRVSVLGLGARQGDALLRVALADGRRVQAVLRSDSSTYAIPARAGALDVAADYALLGAEHIAGGLDHLLFVLGLVLLVRGRRALLWTITAFTLGHSVTLSLATLGFVHAPTAAVEALIAATIVAVALELARVPPGDSREPSASLLGRRPWLVAFAFGLLHGFGFAGALADVGLPVGDIPLALLSFNVGIEIGQLAFVALVLGVLAAVRAVAREHAAPRARLASAYAIGTLAAMWLFERVAVLI